MNQEKRIEKVQSSLTPKQAAILWLDELAKFPNLIEYVSHVHSLPPGNAPLERLPHQIEQAVRQSMKGSPEKEIWPEVRLGVRDVAFLIHIALNTNYKMLSRQREYHLLSMALSHWLHRLILKDAFDCRRDEKVHLKNWVDDAEGSLMELYGFQKAINAMSTQYFDGHPVLFPELSEYLRDIVKRIEGQTELFNKMFSGKKRCKRIDLDSLRNAIKVGPEFVEIVEQSKAEALILIGERESAMELMEKQF